MRTRFVDSPSAFENAVDREFYERLLSGLGSNEPTQQYAAEAGKVEVWLHSGDYPQREGARESHHDMDGKWKRPAEDWEVDYAAEGGGVEHEHVPGDSRNGIGCRCQTLLVDPEDVDPADHAGV